MGLSSSKTKTTQDQTSNQTGTTMPITPDWLTDAAKGYVDRIGAYGDTDPNSYIAGASPLQQQAWGNASNLGGWRPQAATAAGLALDAGSAGANTAGHYPQPQPQMGMKADPRVGPQIAQGAASGAGGAPAFDDGAGLPGMAFGQGQPGLVSGQGYSPAPSMPGYAQPRPGQPIGAQNPAITGASQMGQYQNPWDSQVVDTTLAGFDHNAAVDRARMEAAGAGSGAFGGSRWGVAEGAYGADSARNRAATEAQLRQTGFNTAAGFGITDAAAGNDMLKFDAGQRDNAENRRLAASQVLGQQASQYGADTRADIGTMSALGDQQRGIEQAYAAAPLAQLQMMGQLSGMTPYDILVGNQVNTNGASHSTGTQSSSPSLFNQLLQLGSAASMFV